MENITKVQDYTVTGTFDIDCSFRSDKDGTEVKQVTLRVKMSGTPLKDIITKALSPVKIAWQNGPGRNKFDSWKNRSTIEINFTSPGRSVKTPEEYEQEYFQAFVKAGLDKKQAKELAHKAVFEPVE